MITIFTPTFNRKNELKNLYKSLLMQADKNFVWLIIDDGSTDESNKLINKWIVEDLISIKYYFKKNGGVLSAYLYAFDKCLTDYIAAVDSDDLVKDNFVYVLNRMIENSSNCNDIAGFVFLTELANGQVNGTKFPDNIKKCRLYDLYNKYKVKGDKQVVISVKAINSIDLKLYEDEKGMPEGLLFNKIDRLGNNFYLVNEIVRITNYRNDGISANTYSYLLNSPKSNRDYQYSLYSMENTIKRKIKSTINYGCFNYMINFSWEKSIEGCPNRIIFILLLPITVIYYYIHFYSKVQRREK